MLAAKIAACTCGGASAGAAAVPSGRRVALEPGATMGAGSVNCAPPVLGDEPRDVCAAAPAGNASKQLNNSSAKTRGIDESTSFVGLRG